MGREVSDFEKYFRNNNSRLIAKWNHYFDIYERHFNRFKNKEIVSQGGSLRMWKDYFGNETKIYGIDVDPRCKKFEENNVKIFIGSQSDRNFLRKVKDTIPPVDILIDDGGHTMRQQKVSFEELFDHVKENGVYLCEDLHTSYWPSYGGGYKRVGTFIQYSKKFIDQLNAFHSRERLLKANSFTRSVNSVHYYDSMLVIEKKKRGRPYEEKTGVTSFNNEKSLPAQAHSGEKVTREKIRKIATIILGILKLPGLR